MAMSADERRARDRERKREKRAAERAAREAVVAEVAAAHKKPKGELPSMVDQVRDALAAMKWLQLSDVASVAQAKSLAVLIDECTGAGDIPKALSAHRALSRVLNDLGGTPTVRTQHELRSLKLVNKSGGGDDGDTGNEGSEGSAIVSKFERPKKKARR